MNKFSRFFTGGKYLFLIFSAIYLISCSEESQITSPNTVNQDISLSKKKPKQNQWPSEIHDSTYGKIVMDYSLSQNDFDIHPNAYQCGTKTTWGWGLVDFLPKSGKTVGVWPYEFTTSNLTTLRTHWGYNKLLFAYGMDNSKWNIATTAGYSLGDIMISITTVPDANRYDLIDHYGNAYAYYVDEPADQNHSMGQVRVLWMHCN